MSSELKLLDAEQILMAEMLFDGTSCDWEFIFTNLNEDCFTKISGLKDVFNACKKIYSEGITPDFQSIRLEVDKPSSELMNYTEYTTNSLTLKKACIKLKASYFGRLAKRIVNEATDGIENKADAIDADLVNAANDIIFKVSDLVEAGTMKTDVVQTKDIAMDYLEYIDNLKTGKIQPGLKTGFSDLDNTLIGLKPGQLIILSAYESMGKTSVLLNLVNNLLLQGKSCLVFSLEMNDRELMDRMVSIRTSIPLNKIKGSGALSEEEYNLIGKAVSELSNSKLFICTDMDVNSSTMLHYAKKLQKKYGLDFIGIDYFGLMVKNEEGESEFVKYGYCSRGLKKMAKVLNIPIMILSQFRRPDGDIYLDKMPSRKMLKGSGDIEADANIVLILHRKQKDEFGKPLNRMEQEKAFILIDKNRDGATGMIKLHYNLDTQKVQGYADFIPEDLMDVIK